MNRIEKKFEIREFWEAIVHQKETEIRKYFNKTAIIRQPNTNEEFSLEEFIEANCKYPGKWDGEIERIEKIEDLIITITRVFNIENTISFRVISFINIKDNKIISMDEYWSKDGEAPKWRLDMKLGKKIK